MSDQANINIEDEMKSKSNFDESENITKDETQTTVHSTPEIDNSLNQSTEVADPNELNSKENGNQDSLDKTNDDDNTDQTNSNKSRELKSLLALSKEANLDTNIAHKRKETAKKKEPSKKLLTESRRLSKGSHENRFMKFPVTAETELEQEMELEKSSASNPDTPTRTPKKVKENPAEIKTESADDSAKKRKMFSNELKLFKTNKDIFCWRCHREGVNIACETCPRSYHQRCLKQTITDIEHWPCPECVAILKAESTQTRSEALKGMTLEHLCNLLKFAVSRMIQCQGSEPFLHPVSDKDFPEYKKYIIQPMDLTKIEKNIKNNLYGSTQAFEADAKWLLHNSIIFNSTTSKLSYTAKNIIKVCKQEMAEIENCPNCYLNANTKKRTWFVEVCPKPHILVWAKLKGFPYWPAKVMSFTQSGMVDVRFFGAHDRAWVHYKECFLYSEKDPNTFKQKRYDIEECIEELNVYVENLKSIFGEFKYAPFRTFPDPNNELKLVQMFLPKYKSVKTYSSGVKRKQMRENFNRSSDSKSHSSEDNDKDTSVNNIETEKTENVDDVKENQSSISNEQEKPSEVHDKSLSQHLKKYSDSDKNDESFSDINSPLRKEDCSMEGYGTDDDLMPENDLKLMKKNRSKFNEDEEKMEDEDEDTQVSNNISLDKNTSVTPSKVRGGIHHTPGKIKVAPRKSEDSLGSYSEDSIHHQRKSSRRNSDQSVKSDSSRLSNISEKINKVEISEDMEVTLGKDDGGVSISENITPTNGESSKSGSDSGIDHKRKPVQVDIDNAEFTISPSSKLKISEKLMKRLSDSGSDQENGPVETVKKSFVENPQTTETTKSQTDMLIEKFKDIVEHKVVDFGESLLKQNCEVTDDKFIEESEDFESNDPEPIEESTDNATDKSTVENVIESSDNIENGEITNSVENIDDNAESSTSAEIINEIISDEEKQKSSVETKEDNEIMEIDTSEITSTEERNINSEQNKSSVIEEAEQENSASKEATGTEDDTQLLSNKETLKRVQSPVQTETSNEERKKQKIMTQPSITEFTNNKNEIESSQEENETLNKESTKKDYKNTDVINIVGDFDEEEEECMDTVDELAIDKKNIFNIIHSSLNKEKNVKDQEITKDKIDNTNEKLPNQNEFKPQSILMKHQSAEELIKKSSKQFHTYSNNKNKLKLAIQQQTSSQHSNKNEENANVNGETSKVESRKRKSSSEDNSHSQAKHFKFVSIDKIMNRDLENKESHNSSLKIVRETTEKTQNLPEQSNVENVIEDMIPEDEIKSEPNSDDDFDETENFEAKKKYLSALNISEKSIVIPQEKEHEIRTRAKAEEKRERFRIVDNLTKVIDDVALNYSAKHQGERFPSPKRLDRRRSYESIPGGEIYVKSFAKIKELTQGIQQRARKSFPAPVYIKNPNKKDLIQVTTKKELPKVTATSSSLIISSATAVPRISINASAVTTKPSFSTFTTTTFNMTTSTVTSTISSNVQKSTETPVSTTLSHVILFPASTINYGSPIMNSVLGVVPSITSVPLTSVTSQQSVLKNSTPIPNVSGSQNYIPQSEGRLTDGIVKAPVVNAILNNLLEQSASAQPREEQPGPSEPSTSRDQVNAPTTTRTTIPIGGNAPETSEDEFALLNSLIPENVSRAVSELLLRPPPRLKPRPPGILSNTFDEGSPSSAGDVTTRINSVAHRMGDYFRGMLIETLEDLGKANNPEAKIVALQQELETVKHRHNLELSEIRKNICTILKDIQKSIAEERERVVDETRMACEAETIKRIELAKSKQWCANCSKEAQFYCCWNTSYCDYPCQQKHWPKHMGKCTQNIEKTNNTSTTPSRTASQSVILRPSAPPKPGMGQRIITKPTKVYVNKAAAPQKTIKTLTTSGNHLTVIETTPGNYELVNNGSIVTGKLISTNSNIYSPKFKSGNILSMTASTSGTRPSLSSSASPKMTAIGMPVQAILEDNS